MIRLALALAGLLILSSCSHGVLMKDCQKVSLEGHDSNFSVCQTQHEIWWN